MNLKRITLLTAIAQTLALLCNAYNFVAFLGRTHGGEHNPASLITWPISLLAQAMLAFFLFYLFARQKAD
jgi:hypothetical protein